MLLCYTCMRHSNANFRVILFLDNTWKLAILPFYLIIYGDREIAAANKWLVEEKKFRVPAQKANSMLNTSNIHDPGASLD